MERSNSSDNGRDDPDFWIFCFCGEPAPLWQSATRNNRGRPRRYFGCSKNQKSEDCGFFCWYEPSMGQDRNDLGPVRVQITTKALRTDENKKKKKKKKTLMDHSIWRNLPPEIIERDVLSLLPVKFLCRLKCVSSKWNSLISSPNFAKTHRHITNNTPNKPQKTLLISSYRDLYSVNFAAVSPTAEKLDFGLSVQNPTDKVRGWGSCNGLVLISVQGTSSYDLFLLNPFTRECKKLPNTPFSNNFEYYEDHVVANGLGYDSSTDDYKVVMLRRRLTPPGNHMGVYSLKTDAWRRIHDTGYEVVDEVAPEGNFPGVFFNERLHWLCTNTHGSLVVGAFDLSDEMFKELELPTPFPSSYNPICEHSLSVVHGSCLCLVISTYLTRDEIDAWMMMKYGVRESWTKFTIAKVMFLKGASYLASEEEFLLRLTEKYEGGEVQRCPEKLVGYNPKRGTLRDLVVCGFPTPLYTVGGNYLETLVSPNHGGQIWRNYEAT